MPFSRFTLLQLARPAKRIRSTLARLRSPATSQWSRIAPPQRGSGRRVSRKVTTRPVQRGDIAGSWERNAFFPTSVNDETYGRLSDAPALQSLWTFSERQLEFLSAAEAATNIEDSAATRCQLPAVSTQLSVQRSASKISRNFFAKCKEVTEEKLIHFSDNALAKLPAAVILPSHELLAGTSPPLVIGHKCRRLSN